MVGGVFFRSPDLPYSIAYLKAMFVNFDFFHAIPSDVAILVFNHFNLVVFAIAILISMPIFARKNNIKVAALLWRESESILRRLPFLKMDFGKNGKRILIYIFRDTFLILILLLAIIRLAAGTHNPFIYFQF